MWHEYGEMVAKETVKSRRKARRKPLDAPMLDDLALSYAARFATSAAKLRAYLLRKIRERGLAEGSEDIDVEAVVARMVEHKYVDDEAYGRARSASLLRRGYGPRRVSQALRAAGIDEELREALAPDLATARHAMLALARKRGFGPFGSGPPDRKAREKQIASLLRAGHGFDAARAILDCATAEQAEEWAYELDDEEH